MLTFALYLVFTGLNCFIFFKQYLPTLLQNIQTFETMNSVVKSRSAIIISFLVIKYIQLRQKWFNNVTCLSGNRYQVDVVLKGKLVKFIVEPHENPPAGIFDEAFEKCLTDEFLPYFLYAPVKFSPEIVGQKTLNLYYNSGHLVELTF